MSANESQRDQRLVTIEPCTCDKFQLMDEAELHRDQQWQRRCRKEAAKYQEAAELALEPAKSQAYREFVSTLRAMAAPST